MSHLPFPFPFPFSRAACGPRGVLLLALLAIVLCPAASARAENVGGVDVIVQPLPNRDTTSGDDRGVIHGYVECRVQLKNPSATDHVVELAYPARRGGGGYDGSMATSRTVRVLGGQEATVSLFEPPSGSGSGNGAMRVRVDGGEPREIPVGSLRGWGRNYPPAPPFAVLVSRGVPQDFRDRAGAAPPMPGSGGPTGFSGPTPPESLGPACLRSDVPVNQWSPNWLGYSCYDAVLLTGQEVDQMPAPVQAALRRYVECGGTLVVHGQKVPDVFSRDGRADGTGGYQVGLGRVVASSNGGEPTWEAAYRRLTEGPAAYLPADTPRDVYAMLVAEATVPVRGLFLLVVVFAVGIGPVNVWLLSKFRKRIWLWWNVPAISLLTCGAVFCYALFSEGWTSRAKIASLTLLDQRSHRATTMGYVSLYCPLTPGDGLHFAADTDVALLTRDNSYSRYNSRYPPGYRQPEGGPRSVDWTGDQHLTAGWVSSRVPAYFQIRKNEDRRERLSVVQKADGSVTVVNALGADVQRVVLADASGRLFEGRDIAAGAEARLSVATASWKLSAGPQAELRRMITGREWLGSFHAWGNAENLGPLLAPGCYVALLAESPFIESPLAGVDRQDTAAIVCGICEGNGDVR
jgi:hypothetical protein